MKNLARFILVWIFVSMVGSIAGYVYFYHNIASVFVSKAQIYVVPGVVSEDSLRADDGGLKDDFAAVFLSKEVIADAQREIGTSEDLAAYITVETPKNSNIIEIICSNPDQNTAKKYADTVAKSALKTTSLIPVTSLSILSEGTSDGIPQKPHLYRNTAYFAAGFSGALLILEIIVGLIIISFRKKEVHDEEEYNKYYGEVIRNIIANHSLAGIETGKFEQEAAAALNAPSQDTKSIEEKEVLDKISRIEESSFEVIGRIPR